MSASLVGSEMCIRDRCCACGSGRRVGCPSLGPPTFGASSTLKAPASRESCLLYTSDAADDM
eukprot:12738095-Alexandrium_andersonii.AAC.1